MTRRRALGGVRGRRRTPMRAVPIALVVACCLTGSPGFAGEGLSITLDEARGIALANNKTLGIAAARESAAAARLGQARSAFFPQVSGAASYTRLDQRPYMDTSSFGDMFDPLMAPFMDLVDKGYLDPGTLEGLGGDGSGRIYMGDDDIYSIGLTVQQLIFAGGAALNGYSAAKHALLAEAWTRERGEGEIRYAVTEAYFNLVRARAGLEVAEACVEQMAGHLEDLESMRAEGIVLERDVMMARVRMSSTELERNRAEHAVHLASAALCFRLGIDLDTELDPLDPLEDDRLPALEASEWIGVALKKRPDLKAMEERVETAGKAVAVAHAEAFPRVVLVGNYSWDRPDRSYEPKFYDRWDVTLALQMNLFDWGRIRNRVKELRSGELEAELGLEIIEDVVRLDVKRSCLERDEAVHAARIAMDGVMQARENLRITRESFLSGVATNSDVLDAQSALTAAEMQRIDALSSLRLAEARLELATGVTNR